MHHLSLLFFSWKRKEKRRERQRPYAGIVCLFRTDRRKKKRKRKQRWTFLPISEQRRARGRIPSLKRRRKNGMNAFRSCLLSDAEEEKRTDNVLFSFPFIMKQKERTHSLSPFREEERKSSTLSFPFSGEQTKRKRKANVTFPSSFFPLPQTEWRISPPFPWKKKKTRRRKNADRRKKDKNKKERKEGKRRKKRENESWRNGNETRCRKAHSWRRRAGKEQEEDSRQEAGNGAENAIFRLMIGMTAGRRILLHFRFPFALVNMGRVVNHISPFFSPSPSWHERLLPSPSLSFFLCISAFICGLQKYAKSPLL